MADHEYELRSKTPAKDAGEVRPPQPQWQQPLVADKEGNLRQAVLQDNESERLAEGGTQGVSQAQDNHGIGGAEYRDRRHVHQSEPTESSSRTELKMGIQSPTSPIHRPDQPTQGLPETFTRLQDPVRRELHSGTPDTIEADPFAPQTEWQNWTFDKERKPYDPLASDTDSDIEGILKDCTRGALEEELDMQRKLEKDREALRSDMMRDACKTEDPYSSLFDRESRQVTKPHPWQFQGDSKHKRSQSYDMVSRMPSPPPLRRQDAMQPGATPSSMGFSHSNEVEILRRQIEDMQLHQKQMQIIFDQQLRHQRSQSEAQGRTQAREKAEKDQHVAGLVLQLRDQVEKSEALAMILSAKNDEEQEKRAANLLRTPQDYTVRTPNSWRTPQNTLSPNTQYNTSTTHRVGGQVPGHNSNVTSQVTNPQYHDTGQQPVQTNTIPTMGRIDPFRAALLNSASHSGNIQNAQVLPPTYGPQLNYGQQMPPLHAQPPQQWSEHRPGNVQFQGADPVGAFNQGHGHEGSSNWKPDVFTGKQDGPSPKLWINKFEAYAKFNRWSEARKTTALVLLIGGPAELWLEDLSDHVKADYDLLKACFLTHFLGKIPEWVREEELLNVKQTATQSVDSYAADFKKKLSNLGKSPTEQLHAFVRGLRTEIKAFVIQCTPPNLEQAEIKARLGETVQKLKSDTTPGGFATTASNHKKAPDNPISGTNGKDVSELKDILKKQAKILASVQKDFQNQNKRYEQRSSEGQRYENNRNRYKPPQENKPRYHKQVHKRRRNDEQFCMKCRRNGHLAMHCYARRPNDNDSSDSRSAPEGGQSDSARYNNKRKDSFHRPAALLTSDNSGSRQGN